MSISPKVQAAETYRKFSKAEGNQHIGGQFAVESILRIIQNFRVKSILEVGIGIGCIADAVLHFAKQNNLQIAYYGTESNAFCLEALQQNIDHKDSLHIYDAIHTLPEDLKVDLIIIDGSDKSLDLLARHAKHNTIAFIEGGRFEQVKWLKRIFPSLLHTDIISDYKNQAGGPFDPGKWSCGGALFILHPGLYSRFYWLAQRIRGAYVWRKRKYTA